MIKEVVEKCGCNHGGAVFDQNGRYIYIVTNNYKTN